jgi:hypothetical protein
MFPRLQLMVEREMEDKAKVSTFAMGCSERNEW